MRRPTIERNPTTLLTRHVHEQMTKAGLVPDTYDADFLLGVLMLWLGDHDAVLTAHGVERT